MRPIFKAAICILALWFSACELKLKRAKTPPAPQPTVAQAEPAPPPAPVEPVSTPQTQVRLPQPQPINPEAIVTPPVPPEPAPIHAKKKGRPTPAPPPAKPEPVETAEAPATPEAPPQRLEPLISEQQRLQREEEISARLKEVKQTLSRVTARPLSELEKRQVQQINNFTDQAYKAKDQGDIQKASGLADRALLLVQDLARGR